MEAEQHGVAPKVVLNATDSSVLQYVHGDVLRRYAFHADEEEEEGEGEEEEEEEEPDPTE